jgi:tripartite-type tricarboxylate transporter receptor subunit TctC
MGLYRAFAASTILAATLGAAWPAMADMTEFYTGKTITLVIGMEGASYARTIGRHLVKFVPGNPSILFKTITDDGGERAASGLFQLSPGDGLTIGQISPETIMAPLIVPGRYEKSKFDPLKFEYLGSAASSVYVCIAESGAPATSFAQARVRPLIMGSNRTGGPTRDMSQVLMNLLGAQFRMVNGYRDRDQILEALQHGEIHGLCGMQWSTLKQNHFDLVEDKKVNLLLQYSLDGDKELINRGVPTVWDYVKDQKDHAALVLLTSSLVFARPFVAPPGTPRAQVNALRVAFERTMKDVDFRSDARKNQIDIAATTGEVLQRLVEKIYRTPDDIVQRAQEARKPRGAGKSG